MGYHRAGFTEILGVDIAPQPRYPFDFVQADALDYPLDGFDLIHASPPCQGYSHSRFIHGGSDAPKVVNTIRDRLMASGTPWILENVVGAPMQHGILLCGTALGMNVRRHRLFDSSHFLWAPGACRHSPDNINVVGHGTWNYQPRGKAQAHWTRTGSTQTPLGVAVARAEFGTPWMILADMAQAIPPAYTEYLGAQMRAILEEAE